jgi:catechol 2,3-dioxygenase-like lactoylglutathione lyase family enzyme
MLGPIHHVGYLAGDLDAGVATLRDTYGVTPREPFELAEWGVRAVFLDGDDGSVLEVFTLADGAVSERRRAGVPLRLDHVAFVVPDLDAALTSLRASGAQLLAPDGTPIDAPVERGGLRHIWTFPAASEDLCLQLIGS